MLMKSVLDFFMSKSQQALTELQIARRIKDGRGQGFCQNYKPWLFVQDVPSQGRSHRVFSQKTGRVHHLLSDLELAVFLVFEWAPSITDIREQFPLRREDTRMIAAEHGLRHPSVRGVDQVMSSDFLIDSNTAPHRQFAVQVKPLEALSEVSTIEKLELERRYWLLKQTPWYLITECEIDPIVKQNLEWLYPAKTENLVGPELLTQLPLLHRFFNQAPNAKIIDICKKIDSAYELELGHTLRDIRTLTANGFLKFNIHKAFRTITAAELTFCQFSDTEALLNVANQ